MAWFKRKILSSSETVKSQHDTRPLAAEIAPVSEQDKEISGPFVLHKAHGLNLLLDPTSLVDNAILSLGRWEPEQLTLMQKATRALLTDNRGAFLDIGAYWGLYGMLAAQSGVEDVHLFEPDRKNFSQLQAQLFLNSLSQSVTVHHVAVSEADGTVSFRKSETIPDGNRAGTGVVGADFEHARVVECRRLDSLFDWKDRNLVVKLDVEGHEPSALRGMSRLIAQNRFFIQVEIFDQHMSETMAAAESVGLRLLKVIHVDHYFTNIPEGELGWLVS